MPNNQSLILSPYNTYYPKLQDHLESAGLISDINHWDNPICVGASSGWSLMNPTEFYKTEIPFKMDGPTKVHMVMVTIVTILIYFFHSVTRLCYPKIINKH